MANERERIVVTAPYAEAIGRAAYIFAYLEWNVVWCCEKIAPGYIKKLKKKTAGKIGTDFLKFSETLADDKGRAAFVVAAEAFARLVLDRNNLLHAKPATAQGGEQRLFHNGYEWTVERINSVADSFAACAIEINDLFYAWLN
jgi:hypothetical protein